MSLSKPAVPRAGSPERSRPYPRIGLQAQCFDGERLDWCCGGNRRSLFGFCKPVRCVLAYFV